MNDEWRTELVVGTASGKVWSQVARWEISGGVVLGLLSLEYLGEGDVLEVAGVGAGLLESIKGEVGGGEELGKTVQKIGDELGEGLELELVLVKLTGEEMEIVGREGEVYLARGKNWGRVWEGSEERVKGKLERGDEILVVTQALTKRLGLVKLKRIMEEKGGMEELGVVIHAEGESAKMAAMRVKVEGGGVRMKEKWWQVLGEVKKRWREGGRQVGVERSEERRKTNSMVGAGLLILLIVGIGVGIVSRNRVEREKLYQKVEEIVESKITEAGSVVDLNPERAQDLLKQAEEEVENYRAKGEEENGRGEELARRVEEAKQIVFKQEEGEVRILTELAILGIVEAEEMKLAGGGNLILLDEQEKVVVGVNVEDKSNWKWKFEAKGRVIGMTIKNNKLFFLEEDRVEEGKIEGGELVTVIERDELWGEPGEIASYGANLYLLDKGQGEIWKYPGIDEGYGARRRWFGAGIVLDLSKVVGWEVDGEVWLVTATGKLERYDRGVPVEFEMEGFPAMERGDLPTQHGGQILVNPTAVATSENEVYVLEAGAGRVVVFEKESGKYEKQIVNQALSEGRELVVHEGKGYVLLSDRIGWFEL